MKISTKQAADIIGVSQRRVQKLVKDGRLKSQLVGGVHLLDLSAVQQFAAKERPAHRPRKQT